MATVHGMSESWAPFESSLINSDKDEAEIDYSCIFNTGNELDRIGNGLSSNSTESFYSNNIPTQVNERAYINIIKMQEYTSSEYQAFFTYENLFSKYVMLKPLKEVPGSTSSISEIAEKLIDIFSLFGVPRIFESSNGKDFGEKLVRELRRIIPALKIIHGNILRQNYTRRNFKTLIESWQKANPSRPWHEGLHFIQVHENTCNFSGNQKKPSLQSPAAIFFKRNLINHLLRFGNNNVTEAIDELCILENKIEEITGKNSSTPSPISFNDFNSNDNVREIVNSNLINNVQNATISRTENSSTYVSKNNIECSVCKRIFKKKCYLINHMRSHKITLKNETKDHSNNFLEDNLNTEEITDSNINSRMSNVEHEVNEKKTERRSNRILLFNIKPINICKPNRKMKQANTCKLNSEIKPVNNCKSNSKLQDRAKFDKDDKGMIKITQYSNKQYECDICKKKLTTKNSLRRHIFAKHMRPHVGQKLYRCDICENVYMTMNTLRRHMTLAHDSERIYECEICKKKFKQVSDLTRHKKIHNDERPYQCHVCEKKFKYKNSFNMHIELHYESKSFECDLCKRIFNSKRNVRNHIIFGHANIRPFQCKICKTTFTRKHTLTRHNFSVHANVRPFECDICKVSFPRKHTLLRHITGVHANIRPFKCTICKTTFSNKQNLERHVVLVHSIECPYFCCICDKKFKRLDNLNSHMTLH